MRIVRDRDAAAMPASPVHRAANVPVARSAFVSVIGLAFMGSALLYYPTTRYGFNYDDYHWVRPYSLHEVLASFWGTWDATHLEVAFYRPLTVTLYAMRFLAFGFSASAYHWASIFFFAVAAALFGAFLLRMFGSRTLAFAGTVLLLIHPAATDTLVAWTINQYQLAEVIILLCALHWWLTCKEKPLLWWLPLVAFALLCFLFKEDGIMLLIAILMVSVTGAIILKRPIAPPPLMYLIACVAIVAFLLLRYAALRGAIGGYGTPNAETILHNLSLGPRLILLGRYGPEWSKGLNIFLTIAFTLLGVFTAFARRNRRAMFLILSGVAISISFDLPLALVGRTDQHFLPVHFLTIGHTFILLGCLDALYQSAVAINFPRVSPLTACFAIGAATYVALLCLPPRLHLVYTPAQLNAMNQGGFYLTESDPAGNTYAWTKGDTSFTLDFLVRKPVTLITDIRSAAVAGGPDAPVRIRVNGEEIGQLLPDAHTVAFQSLSVRFVPPASGTKNLDIAFVTPTFLPPTDKRNLGTMVQRITIDKSEAWSGVKRRRWLYWALPCLAVAAIACHAIARRRRSVGAGAVAVALCGVGCLCVTALLIILARIGTLDKSRYLAWVYGCMYLDAMFLIAAISLFRTHLRDWFHAHMTDHRPFRSVLPSTAAHRLPRTAIGVVFVISVALAITNLTYIVRQLSLDWHPYSEQTLRYDKIVVSWGDKVPEELRQTLAHK